MGTDLFFPEPDDTETIEKAIRVCRRCPVRQECLSYARRTGTEYGVWGGVFLG
jgi:WhiB family redox-sensing transcriptional regulator